MIYGNKPVAQGLHPSRPKSAVEKALLAYFQDPKRSAPSGDGRINVYITRCSTTLLDDDNVSVKFILDAIRDSGLIPDDDRESIKLHLEQIQVGTKEEIGTHIRIVS